MPHVPPIVWILLAVVPVAITILLAVEAKIVKPANEEDRRGL